MEQSFIAWAKQRASRLPKVKLGIGDDCSLIGIESVNTTTSDLVVTTDALCDGTHFILADCGARAVGRKLIAVNLSDLASMGATPVAVFLTLCLPKTDSDVMASEIFEGVFEMASQYQVSIAGGDTNVWSGPLTVNMTAIGQAPSGSSWLRSGAQPGDAIVVTGSLGGSILGKHLRFEPRLAISKHLRSLGVVSAATDISDGLGIDLMHIAANSKCGAELQLDQIPVSDDAIALSQKTNRSPIDHALGDGEDFELLLAISETKLHLLPKEIDGVPLTRIGTFISRTGLWSREKKGVRQLAHTGYVHGATQP